MCVYCKCTRVCPQTWPHHDPAPPQSHSAVGISMSHWRGYTLLQERDREIYFKDINDIWHALQHFKQSNKEDGTLTAVYLRQPWGQSVQNIGHGGGNEREKTRRMAELCWRIFCTLMYGKPEMQGPRPWQDAASRVWRDNKRCPGKIESKRVPADGRGNIHTGTRSRPYPEVILGTQIWELDGKRSCVVISLSLHRLACWLAEGDPPAGAELATHKCGHQDCLRLRCMKWGTAGSNAEDRHRHGRWRVRR